MRRVVLPICLMFFLLLASSVNGRLISIPTGKAEECILSIIANVPNGELVPGSKIKIPVVVKLNGNPICKDKIFVISFCLWAKLPNGVPADISGVYLISEVPYPTLPGYNTPNCDYIYIHHAGVPTEYNTTLIVEVPHKNQKVTLPGKSFINWNNRGVILGVWEITNGFYYNGSAYDINARYIGKFKKYSEYRMIFTVNTIIAYTIGNTTLWLLLFALGVVLYFTRRNRFLGILLISFSALMVLQPVLSNFVNKFISSAYILASSLTPSAFYDTRVKGAIQDLNDLTSFVCEGTSCGVIPSTDLLSYQWYYKDENHILLSATADTSWREVIQYNKPFAYWIIKRTVSKDSWTEWFFWHKKVGVIRIRDKIVALKLPIGSNIYPVHCRVYEVVIDTSIYPLLKNVNSLKELEKIISQYIILIQDVKPEYRNKGYWITNIINEFSIDNVPRDCIDKVDDTKVLSPACKYYTIVACDYAYITPKITSTEEIKYKHELNNVTIRYVKDIFKREYNENTGKTSGTNYTIFAILISLVVASLYTSYIRRKS